jgi:hypothetical protein
LWSARLEFGVLDVVRVRDFGGSIVEPIGSAALIYSRLFGQAQFQYRHQANPSVFIGQTFLEDDLLINGVIPIGTAQSTVTFSGSGGYSHARVIDLVNGTAPTSIDLFQINAAINWRPDPKFELSLRYSLFDQQGSNALPTFSRNQILVAFTAAYPESAIPNVPRSLPQRVDRADSEPGIRESASPRDR